VLYIFDGAVYKNILACYVPETCKVTDNCWSA